MSKRLFLPAVATWLAVLVLFSVQHPSAQGRGGAPVTLPDGAGKDLVQTTCSKCHGLGLIANGFGYTRDG